MDGWIDRHRWIDIGSLACRLEDGLTGTDKQMDRYRQSGTQVNGQTGSPNDS